MSRPLSLFAKPQEDQNSRLMKNLLAIHEQQQHGDYEDHRPLSHREDHPHDPVHPPKRPTSANPLKRRLKSANSSKLKPNQNHNHSSNPNNVVASREDLVAEVYDLKKKNLALEEQVSWMKTENQRLESEAVKQQRRIDQLLNLSDGVKSSANSQHVRKEIEKSILVRQLKSQLNLLKNVIAEKETEIDHLKRDMRSSHIKEVETERDEYSVEIQRLLKVIENLKSELSRERRRREWNRKLAGETGDDLRKELARLTSGYQTILTNLSHKSHSSNPLSVYSPGKGNNMLRPSSAGHGKSSEPQSSGGGRQRPQSANIRGKDYSYNNNNSVPTNNNNRGKIAVAASPSDNWLESFNLDRFGENNNKKADASNPTSTTDNNQYTNNQTSNQPDEYLPSENIFTQKGKPLSEFATMKPSPTPANQQHDNEADEDDDYEEGEEELPSEKIPVYDHQSPPPDYIHPAPAMEPISLSSQMPNPFITPSVHDEKLHQYHMIDEHELQQHHLHHQPVQQPPSQFLPPQYQQQTPPMIQPKPLISHVMTTIGNAANILPPNQPFGPGDRVQAEYRGKGRWYDGVIRSYDSEHGTYYISYDDGEEEMGVLPIRVRLISKKKPDPKFSQGDKVEALYYSGSSWYKGTIKGAGQYQEGKESYVYDILYSDGEREKNVLEQNIRLLNDPITNVTASPNERQSDRTTKSAPSNMVQKEKDKETKSKEPEAKYKVGEKVEGCFAKDNIWYRATIKAIKFIDYEARYDLDYDDGDRETGVVEAKIRSLPSEAIPKAEQPPTTLANPITQNSLATSTTPAYQLYDIVEAYYDEFENWFRGKIVAIHPSNPPNTTTYHIIFDDGDEENNVFSDRIRYFQKYSGDYQFQYGIDDEVEARYKLGKEWYRGIIKRLEKDPDYGPVYDIAYEDGDFEEKVRENNMKLIRRASRNNDTVPKKSLENSSSSPRPDNTAPSATNAPQSPSGDKNTTDSTNPATITNSGSKSHIVTTNLDSFLNELSDDEDDEGGGGIGDLGLDGGKAVTLKSNEGMLIQEPVVKGNKDEEEEDAYNEDFDA